MYTVLVTQPLAHAGGKAGREETMFVDLDRRVVWDGVAHWGCHKNSPVAGPVVYLEAPRPFTTEPYLAGPWYEVQPDYKGNVTFPVTCGSRTAAPDELWLHPYGVQYVCTRIPW